ncbi:hypothetical protein [Corynebacterium falsenii]|uniref:hypothetical protein n=1 Tax=Corynebacterium falsenii TaxID=108486 RepID=UPI003FD2AF2C
MPWIVSVTTHSTEEEVFGPIPRVRHHVNLHLECLRHAFSSEHLSCSPLVNDLALAYHDDPIGVSAGEIYVMHR